jgi:hypothetical protein
MRKKTILRREMEMTIQVERTNTAAVAAIVVTMVELKLTLNKMTFLRR